MDISYCKHLDDLTAIRFIPSSWSQPHLFHVLKEYGDYDDTEYLGLFDTAQIYAQFQLNLEDCDLSGLIKKTPNDASLGGALRKLNNKLK